MPESHRSQVAVAPQVRHTSSPARPLRLTTKTGRTDDRTISTRGRGNHPSRGSASRRSIRCSGGQPSRSALRVTVIVGPRRVLSADGTGGGQQQGHTETPTSLDQDVARIPGRAALLAVGLVVFVDDHRHRQVGMGREGGRSGATTTVDPAAALAHSRSAATAGTPRRRSSNTRAATWPTSGTNTSPGPRLSAASTAPSVAVAGGRRRVATGNRFNASSISAPSESVTGSAFRRVDCGASNRPGAGRARTARCGSSPSAG